MARCWEIRDCIEDGGELIDTCPHPNELFDRCPTKCAFARCQRSTREYTSDPALIFDPTVDREVAVKEECLHCAFFLRKAPKVGAPSE